MPKNSIPVRLARSIRNRSPKPTWKQVGIELHKLGYPPAPELPFQADSILHAVSIADALRGGSGGDD